MWLESIDENAVHVALTSGHALTIPQGGREVPEMFVAEALRTGRVVRAHRPGPGGAGAPAAVAAEKTARAKPEQPAAQARDDAQAKTERIKDAIKRALDAGDESFLNAKGLPDARKLDSMVGEPVSAAERDVAWTALQAEADADA